MRIAVLVKQVPAPAQLVLSGGRLRRDGVELQVNAYCRRANAKAVELARTSGGEVVVFTMGPPAADDALREMIACGASRGVHLCDPAFAGADTLATARALSTALRQEGPFDLVLCGASSIDADTGQVGPEVAALLGVPFVGPARTLVVTGERARARLETEDGYRTVSLVLPAVISSAERLCDPSKADPAERRLVAAERIVRRTAFDLGLKRDEVGEEGSPTRVGPVRIVENRRRRRIAASVDEAVELLVARGALGGSFGWGSSGAPVVEPVPTTGGPGREVWCVLLGDSASDGAELLGEAAALVAQLGGGRVSAVVPVPPVAHAPVAPNGATPRRLDGSAVALGASGEGASRRSDSSGRRAGDVGARAEDGFGIDGGRSVDAAALGAMGADRVLVMAGDEPEEWAHVLARAAACNRPWAILVQGTATGRAIAAFVAARNGCGLVGDAVGLDVVDDRLVAWKPAFSGRLVAAIECSSPVQMATVRPGILRRRAPRVVSVPPVEQLRLPEGVERGRVRTTGRERLDPTVLDVVAAEAVVGVGQGVDRADYALLDELRRVLGEAPLVASRKVTDQSWLPRSRQVGVTGRAIAPRLYVAVGISGKFNHMVGVAGAGTVLAVNADPEAPVFDQADVGLVGDWRPIVRALAATIAAARGSSPPSQPGRLAASASPALSGSAGRPTDLSEQGTER